MADDSDGPSEGAEPTLSSVLNDLAEQVHAGTLSEVELSVKLKLLKDKHGVPVGDMRSDINATIKVLKSLHKAKEKADTPPEAKQRIRYQGVPEGEWPGKLSKGVIDYGINGLTGAVCPVLDAGEEDRSAIIAAVQYLAAPTHTLFAFGPTPVSIERVAVPGLWADASHSVKARLPVPTPHTKSSLLGVVEPICMFALEGPESIFKRPVPEYVLQALTERAGPTAPQLAGVLTYPTLARDWSILIGPASGKGHYDPATGFWIEPTRAVQIDPDAFVTTQDAWAFLRWNWLSEVSFASEADAARAVMGMATMTMHRTVLNGNDKWPGVMVSAGMASSGKTTLCLALCLAVTAQQANFMSIKPDDEAENAKALMSLARANVPVAIVDNFPNGMVLKSAELDKYLTGQFYEGRLLGGNEHARFPAQTMFWVTGNNISAGEDSTTRHLQVRLEPQTDAPQNIQYDRDILAWTEANRDQILSALFCILTSEPEPLAKVGRFTDWFHYVANPIMDASGCLDALDAWKEGGISIEGADEFGEFLEALHKLEGDIGTGAHQGLFAEQIVRLIADEAAAVAHIPFDVVRDILQPDTTGLPKEQAKAVDDARLIAGKKAAHMFVKHMKRRADQKSHGFGLKIGLAKNRDHKMRPTYHAEPIGKSKPPVDPAQE